MTFNQPPPREIPLANRLVALWGGTAILIGWLIGSFGMIFVLLFWGNVDFASLLYFHGHLQTEQGMVTDVEKTHVSEGGLEGDEGSPIYAYYYQFTTAGRQFNGVSYQDGINYSNYAAVTIEFPEGKPEHSRINEMRCAPFGPGIALIIIFPLAGFGMVLDRWLANRRKLRLAIYGLETRGRCIQKQPTTIDDGGGLLYKIIFEFTDRTGITHEITIKSNKAKNVLQGGEQALLYHPAKPLQARPVGDLPDIIIPDRDGRSRPCGLKTILGALIGPVVTLVISALTLCIKHIFSTR